MLTTIVVRRRAPPIPPQAVHGPGAGVAGLAAGGCCVLTHSVFNPKSAPALDVSNLFIATMVIALLIILLIAGALAYTAVRFRHRPGQGEPPQAYGNTRLEIAWTVAPFLLLVALFGAVLNTARLAAPGGDPPTDLTVIGHQWWWELRYGSGVITANEIHLPVGRRFYVALKSADVIHSLWVPQLGPKMDLVPGQTNHMWLEADAPGVYEGNCSEFCGAGHAWMLLRVIAQSPADFAAWEHQQLGYASRPSAGAAAQGARLFIQLTCQSCHAIDTSAADRATELAQPPIAPNLTHVGSRQTLASGRLANTRGAMIAWLHAPDYWKPGVHMPNLQLTPPELQALQVYLEGLK